MKAKTGFQLMLVMIVLVSLVVAAQPVAAQEAPPQNAEVAFPTPEIKAWAGDLATRGGWLAMVIALDLVLGVTCAVKSKSFQWQRLADFLGDYGPKVVGWLCLELFTLLPPDLAAMAGLVGALGLGAYTIILVSAVGSVLSSVQALGIMPFAIPGVKQPQG